MIFRNRMI